MKNFLLGYLEKALNAYLQQGGQSEKRLARMAGKSIGVELLPMQLHFNCHFTQDRVTLDMQDDFQPHTKIKGTPLQLLGALVNKERRHQFFADDLSIEGDAEFAQQVIDLFDHIEIDWEEHASRLIGDASAHHLSKLVNSMQGWMKSAGKDLTQDINDYLHEEAAWFPVREELQEFFADIDTLRMDADRLESRIVRLQAQLNKEDAP